MFEKSWISAERLLRDAHRWIFVGYSMPAAGYEFKHLLKRVQLSRNNSPKFVVIAGGTDTRVTYENYQRFFGRAIKRKESFFGKGLDNEAISAASS